MSSYSLRHYARAKPKLLLLALIGSVLVLSAVAAPALAGGGISTGGSPTGSGGGSHKAHAANSPKYVRLWNNVSHRDKRWASKVAQCESGKDPKAIGGGGLYRGAFQFMKSTWRNSPHSPGGDPIRYAYKTQAVVAVGLKHAQGTSPWPVCG